MPNVKIPEFYRAPLDKIASMPEEDFIELRKALSSVGVTIKPASIAAQVKSKLKNPPPDLDQMLQSLVALAAARVSGDGSQQDLARDIAKSLEIRKDKPKDYDPAAFEKRLESLLLIESLALSARAAEIQHDYARVFVSARIVSDIRSVFKTSAVEPVGALIVHNLKITYFEEGGPAEVFLAMDNSDLASLRKIIDRAESKTAQLEEMIKKTGVQYFESK